MPDRGSVVVIGGTAGLGLEIARFYAGRGRDVVLSSRDAGRAEAVAAEIGGSTTGIGLDLAVPEQIEAALAGVGRVDGLVLAAIERDENAVRTYNISTALRLVTLKLVGYTEVAHALASRLGPEASIVVFGGQAVSRPYPGSTTVTTVNGGVTGLVRTLAVELAPVRANALHPGIVGDSPYWSGKAAVLEGVKGRTPTGRLVTMKDIVGAVDFLLENSSVNGIDLHVNGGTLLV
jgi:NAD(P)-dependent dehydrogenase (short-subunit alcohol dehydrogenase family)